MRLKLRSLWRYRPRILTLLLLIVLAALLVLANLIDATGPRHQAASAPAATLAFDHREHDDQSGGNDDGPYVNVSYGWPLLWRQYIIETGWTGPKVHGQYYSRSRLVGNLMLWLAMLAAPAAACEWLLRHHRLRLRWSLRTMFVAVGLAAILCAWFAAARKRVDAQDALIAAVTSDHGNVWVEHRGPRWLDVLGVERFRRYVTAVHFGHSAETSVRDGAFGRLAQLTEVRYFETKCLVPGMVEALRGKRCMRSLSIDGWNQAGETVDKLIWRDLFAAIGQMPLLERVDLDANDTEIAREGLASLAGLARLNSLRLKRVANSGPPLLEHLPALPRLEVVDLSYSEIRDRDLPYLAALPRLKSLSLADTEVTGAGLAALAASDSLEELTIGADAASPAGFDSLLAVKRLKKVHIDAYRGQQGYFQVWAELAIDDGGAILVPAGELVGCQRALDALRRSKPEIAIDDHYERPDWPSENMVSLGYEDARSSGESAVHQLLSNWKDQQGAP